MEVQPDFKELLELFNAHKVEYMIVGGYALAFHGAPRFMKAWVSDLHRLLPKPRFDHNRFSGRNSA